MIRIASLGTSVRAIFPSVLAAAVIAAIGLKPTLVAAQSQHPWLDPKLLAAARSEGPLAVYTSINEQEGLPLFKMFETASGVKVNYVRGNVPTLMSRMTIESRSKPTVDIMHMTAVEKVPPEMLAEVDLPEAKALLESARSWPPLVRRFGQLQLALIQLEAPWRRSASGGRSSIRSSNAAENIVLRSAARFEAFFCYCSIPPRCRREQSPPRRCRAMIARTLLRIKSRTSSGGRFDTSDGGHGSATLTIRRAANTSL